METLAHLVCTHHLVSTQYLVFTHFLVSTHHLVSTHQLVFTHFLVFAHYLVFTHHLVSTHQLGFAHYLVFARHSTRKTSLCKIYLYSRGTKCCEIGLNLVIQQKRTCVGFQHMSPTSILPRNCRCPASILPRIIAIPLQDNQCQTLYPKHP
jgi:hypothetical protein